MSIANQCTLFSEEKTKSLPDDVAHIFVVDTPVVTNNKRKVDEETPTETILPCPQCVCPHGSDRCIMPGGRCACPNACLVRGEDYGVCFCSEPGPKRVKTVQSEAMVEKYRSVEPDVEKLKGIVKDILLKLNADIRPSKLTKAQELVMDAVYANRF